MEKIKYLDDFVVRPDGIKSNLYKTREIETDFTKQYKNCIASIFKLGALATKYILFATENMDNDNIYRHDAYNKKLFAQKIIEANDKPINIGSLDKVAVELSNTGFFIWLSKGIYQINPELFWKDDEKKRVEVIKLSLEFKYNEKIKLYINAE